MQIDRDTIIKEIQRVAREKGVKQLTRSEFSAESGISSWHIYQVFDGWREACRFAGLEPYYQNIPIDDDDLFEEMRHIFISYGGMYQNKI
ncbi:MAG: homing endonuclease associated repeat-containing protein [Candidatus Aminicenantia bacterium]